MAQRQDGRCKALTKKGERCKNIAFTGGHCRIHAAEHKLSLREKNPDVAKVLTSSASLVVLIEKLIQYWPDILYVLEYLAAMSKEKGWRGENTPTANQARLEELKSATVVGAFSDLRHILEQRRTCEGRGLLKEFRISEKDVPSELSDELEEAIQNHQSNLENLWRKREEIENSIYEEAFSFLQRFTEKRNWLYSNYRYYEFSIMVEKMNDYAEEVEQDQQRVFEQRKWRLDRFERLYPQEYPDFLGRHQEFKQWSFMVDYINYLHFLKSDSFHSFDPSGLGETSSGVRPYLTNHLSEEDLAELELVHSRLHECLNRLWSLQSASFDGYL